MRRQFFISSEAIKDKFELTLHARMNYDERRVVSNFPFELTDSDKNAENASSSNLLSYHAVNKTI